MSPPQIGTMVCKGLVCSGSCLNCEGSTYNKERALVGILSLRIVKTLAKFCLQLYSPPDTIPIPIPDIRLNQNRNCILSVLVSGTNEPKLWRIYILYGQNIKYPGNLSNIVPSPVSPCLAMQSARRVCQQTRSSRANMVPICKVQD